MLEKEEEEAEKEEEEIMWAVVIKRVCHQGGGASYAIGSKLAGEQMTAPSTKLWI